MKIVTVGLKGFVNDRSGIFSWTQEILLEHDPMYPDLTPAQQEEIKRSLDQQREIIMANAVAWAAEETARRDEGRAQKDAARAASATAPAPAPVPAAAPAKPSAPETRKAGDEYSKDNRTWTRCMCGNTDINHWSSKDGKDRHWQGCKICGLFLNPDGSVKSMGGVK